MRTAFLSLAGIVAVGMLGAAAFNPDSGLLLESEALWRAFGIPAYIGGFLLPLAGLAVLLQLAIGLVRR